MKEIHPQSGLSRYQGHQEWSPVSTISLLMSITISEVPAKLLVGCGGKVSTSMKYFFSKSY